MKRSLAQLSVLVQSGALDPVDLARETLAAIRACDDQAIFLSLDEDRALREAEAASARIRDGRSLGALDGLPVAWKDLFDLAGQPATAGSQVLDGQPTDVVDAAVVTALAAAGMVSVGRTNMSEFAFSGLGINPHFGTPQNPASTDGHRITGGSSSGSAAAVAAGLVPLSIGSDTGGSVRIPAAFTGIVGYKATRGRYPMEGVFPLSTSLDSLGPLTRTVSDAVLADAAMRGLPVPVIRRGDIKDLSIVIPQTVVFDGAEPEVLAAFEPAIARLSDAGVRIRRAELPPFAEIFELMARHGALVTAEAYVLHRERLSGPLAERMDPRVVARARLGSAITMPDLVTLLAARERLIRAMETLVAPGELIAFPTVPHVAPMLAPLVADDATFFATNGKTLRNTLIGNFLDHCGISIPCGTGEAGMPVGLLLSGLPGTDDHLLSMALSAEAIIRGAA